MVFLGPPVGRSKSGSQSRLPWPDGNYTATQGWRVATSFTFSVCLLTTMYQIAITVWWQWCCVILCFRWVFQLQWNADPRDAFETSVRTFCTRSYVPGTRNTGENPALDLGRNGARTKTCTVATLPSGLKMRLIWGICLIWGVKKNRHHH
jgi:hypothetical protein